MRSSFSSLFFILLFIFIVPATAQDQASAPEKPVYPVFYPDFISENGTDYIHFQWRVDYPDYEKAILTDEKGTVLAELPFPEDTYIIPDRETFPDKIYVTAISKHGTASESLEIDLTRDYSPLLVKPESIEPVTVKQTPGQPASFVLAKSGTPYVVNGVNYCVIRTMDHDAFEPATAEHAAVYDPFDAESMLRQMAINGYNTVRVFIKTGHRGTRMLGLSGPEDTRGICEPYMDNFIDFLSRAAKYGIHVFPCFCENEMLTNDYFRELSGNTNRQSILFSQKGIEAKQLYMKLFLRYIRDKNPKLLDSLLGLAMQNEFAFYSTNPPFSQLTGTYTFLDGREYDMTNDDARHALALAAIQNYYKAMKQTVEEEVPGLLVAEGTFALGAVGKTIENARGIRKIEGNPDQRFPMSAVELLKTDIDFLDFHIYRWGCPGSGKDVFDCFVTNMALNTEEGRALMQQKPVIMGEYGSFNWEEKTIDEAIAFTRLLKDSALEWGFSGSCYWTIDCFEQDFIWNLMWENGKMLRALR